MDGPAPAATALDADPGGGRARDARAGAVEGTPLGRGVSSSGRRGEDAVERAVTREAAERRDVEPHPWLSELRWERAVGAAIERAVGSGCRHVLVSLRATGHELAQPAVVRCEGRQACLLLAPQGWRAVRQLQLWTDEARRMVLGATARAGLFGDVAGDAGGGGRGRRGREELGVLRAAVTRGRGVWLLLEEMGRLHRLEVRLRGPEDDQRHRHGLWAWDVRRGAAMQWERALLGEVEACIERGATVGENGGWVVQPDRAYWPSGEEACRQERLSGAHWVLGRAITQQRALAVRTIQAAEAAVRAREKRSELGAAGACGLAFWGGVETGLGVSKGVQSEALHGVAGQRADELDPLARCGWLEVRMGHDRRALVRPKPEDARQGEGRHDWRAALYLEGERVDGEESAVYQVSGAERMRGGKRGLLRLRLGAGLVPTGGPGRGGRLLGGELVLVVRASEVPNRKVGWPEQVAAVAELSRHFRAAGVGLAEGFLVPTGVRLDPDTLGLSAEYEHKWETARAVASRLQVAAADAAHSLEWLCDCYRFLDALGRTGAAVKRAHAYGLTVGRPRAGVLVEAAVGSGGLVLEGLMGTGWVERLASRVAVRWDEYGGDERSAIAIQERLQFTGLCRSLLAAAQVEMVRAPAPGRSDDEWAVGWEKAKVGAAAAELSRVLNDFDMAWRCVDLQDVLPAFERCAQAALGALRRVQGMRGRCVDTLVAGADGALPGAAWDEEVRAMRRQARTARSGLGELQDTGPVPAGLVADYVGCFGLSLVVARKVRGWGEGGFEGAEYEWWAAAAATHGGLQGRLVYAVATVRPGGEGHIEPLPGGSVRAALERQVDLRCAGGADAWSGVGSVSCDAEGVVRLRFQGGDVQCAWGAGRPAVGGKRGGAAGQSGRLDSADGLSGSLSGVYSFSPGYAGDGLRAPGRGGADGGVARTTRVRWRDGAGRWERLSGAMREAVKHEGAVLVPGGGGCAVEAAEREWRAFVASGEGGRATPVGSQGESVDLRVFGGSPTGHGWCKMHGLGPAAKVRNHGGPLARWADSGAGRGATRPRSARAHMRASGLAGVHVRDRVREVAFMTNGSQPKNGEVHYDGFDSVWPVVNGGKTWSFLSDGELARKSGAHPGVGAENERLDVTPDETKGRRRVRRKAGDALVVAAGLWHSVVSDAATNAVGEWHARAEQAMVARATRRGRLCATLGRGQDAAGGCALEARGLGRSPACSAYDGPGVEGTCDAVGDGRSGENWRARGEETAEVEAAGATGVTTGGETAVIRVEAVLVDTVEGEATLGTEVEYVEVLGYGTGDTEGRQGTEDGRLHGFDWRRLLLDDRLGAGVSMASAALSGARHAGLDATRQRDADGLPLIGTECLVRPTGVMDVEGRHLRAHRRDRPARERWRQVAGQVPRDKRIAEGLDEMRDAVYVCSTEGCAALVKAATRYAGRGCLAKGCVEKKNWRPAQHVAKQLDRVNDLRRGRRALMQRLPQGQVGGWTQLSEADMLRAATAAERAAVEAVARPAGGTLPWGGRALRGRGGVAADEPRPRVRTRAAVRPAAGPPEGTCLDVALAEGRGGGARIEGARCWPAWCEAQREEARVTCEVPAGEWLEAGKPVPVGKVNAYVAGLGVSALVFRSEETAGERRQAVRVWWLGVEGDEGTEWVVIEATGTSHCAFVEAVRGASVRALTERRCRAWVGEAAECDVAGYEYGLAGAWPEADAVGMSDEAAEEWRARSKLRRASSGARVGERDARHTTERGGVGTEVGSGDAGWRARLRMRGTEDGFYSEGVDGGSGPGRGDLPPAEATVKGSWAYEVVQPSALARLGRKYVWRRTGGRWRLVLVAAESASLVGRGRPGEWGLYWARRGGFEPRRPGDYVALGRYESVHEGARHDSQMEALREAEARTWTGRAMVCRRGGAWVVVEPGREETGALLHLVNAFNGTGREENVRIADDGEFQLHGPVRCFCAESPDTSSWNLGAELLTSYGPGFFRRTTGVWDRVRASEQPAAVEAEPQTDAGGVGTAERQPAEADEARGGTCVDEAIALGVRAVGLPGRRGLACKWSEFALSVTEVAEQRRSAGQAAGRLGQLCRRLPAQGPVDAGLVGAYAAATGLKVAVYRVEQYDLKVWWWSSCPACRGLHRAHTVMGDCSACAPGGVGGRRTGTLEWWVVWRAEGTGHVEHVGAAEADSALAAVRACTWEVQRTERRGGGLTVVCTGVGGAWGGAGHPVGMMDASGGSERATREGVSNETAEEWRTWLRLRRGGSSSDMAEGAGGHEAGTDPVRRASDEPFGFGDGTLPPAGGRTPTERGWHGAGRATEAAGGPADAAGTVPQRARDLSLADAAVRNWAGQEELLFWIEGGGQQPRGLTDIVWAAAALGADAQETLVFFARAGEPYDEEDWASGTVAELRAVVVELIAMTLERATVAGARRGAWAGGGGLVRCLGCGERVAAVGEATAGVGFYCPTCWDAWVQGVQTLRQAACAQCDRWTACMGTREWGTGYCWGCWMAWSVSEGRQAFVQELLWQAAGRGVKRGAEGGDDGGRAEAIEARGVRGTPAEPAGGARAGVAIEGRAGGRGTGGGGGGSSAEGGTEGWAGSGDPAGARRPGGVVRWRRVEEAGWASSRPAIFFYSYGTEATWLSSMCRTAGFWGLVPQDAEIAALLGGHQLQKYFTSRETWFCFAKCVFAAVGSYAQDNLRLAETVLRMVPREAKQACKAAGRGGRLAGLDGAAWNEVRVRMMEAGAWMQATGNKGFRERLLQTGDAMLLEASSADSFWGIGMDRASASQVPLAARRQAFGQNWHGAALMVARERIRREAADGGVWVTSWGEEGAAGGDKEGAERR